MKGMCDTCKNHPCDHSWGGVVTKCSVYESSASPACSTQEEVIERLRGQLQNCVNHLERAKRRWPHGNAEFEAAIESANKALYETLMR